MKNFLLALIAFLLWAAFALLFHQYASEHICGGCSTMHHQPKSKESNIETIIKEGEKAKNETPTLQFSITSADGEAILTFPKGFIINSRNGEISIPKELTNFKDSIYSYLNNHQNKELLISAKYLANEHDEANNIHFGNTRADFLKSVLVKVGINPDKIVPKSVLSEYSYDSNGNYYDGISMVFQNVTEERNVIIEEGIANKTLYSDFAIKQFKPDNTLKAYTIELKNYLTKYPDKKVYVEGHTDSIGNDNYEFGLDRANNVKQYLISQGIDPTIIIVSSKGETEPVATNTTEEGKAKNRRIEITIK